ncbi:FAD-binding oxidoreductase [Companilactobacillus sp.]|jgi:predicted ferric reductase|uniref:FAD-binding oxidoreductase n=1 Tax=Companilactobacillus sp. TaxID=2767905 RepID=UPI0025C4B62F|nr:FAD-binding oxidoreductase [Companilactobacillus sp.]MCH4009898.1 FAD-binding oxidoreductase [Companilactobacillus sp.]MCH4052426.1 FAD-binding oxidoreductase [Companilactobacillus sp.]MCH4077840.1 FAD-binding oxidoreductase [Companilactobacillus sp.]MCH4126416.1 FAD-binding oxidoreductase [Companilactobacillus sp.]MCI1312738.1 FAD-binding oxidoreductase [Companilactobacillus sp.]
MLQKHRYSLWLFWLIAIFLLPLPFLQTLSAGLPTIYSGESQAIYYGTIAYVWMLFAVYLSTKPKWLDRLIGLPDMYMVHGILAIGAIVLAFLHKENTQSFGWIKTTGDWAFDLFLGLMIYSLIFMAGWLTNRIPILKKIKHTLEIIFRHELSVWVHRLNIVAVVLVFIHVQLISYIVAIKPFIVLFDVVSGLVLLSYLWAKFIAPTTYNNGTLVKNQPISDNIYELAIKLPNHAKIDLQAGDYVFISFPDIKGLKEMHPFSLATNPNTDENIDLLIRGDGDFTKKLQDLPRGTRVLIDGGYGRYQAFLKEQPENSNIVILAGGIGVTPLLSTIAANLNRKMQVFYTAHNPSDLLATNEFSQWSQLKNFTMHQQVGRYKDDQIFSDLPDNWQQDTIFLISGPSTMMHHYAKSLKRQGASAGSIYYE